MEKSLSSIRQYVESLGCDNLSVFDGKYVGGIYLQQLLDEIVPCIYDLIKLKERSMFEWKNMLEVGSASGSIPFLFHHFLEMERYVIIDDNRHPRHVHRSKILEDVNYTEFIGNSHSKEASEFIYGLDLNYDIIFIDGDHNYEGVLKDVETYSKYAEYCGFLILHDIVACTGVGRLFIEIVKDGLFDLHYFKSYMSESHSNPLGLGVFQSYNFRTRRSDRK